MVQSAALPFPLPKRSWCTSPSWLAPHPTPRRLLRSSLQRPACPPSLWEVRKSAESGASMSFEPFSRRSSNRISSLGSLFWDVFFKRMSFVCSAWAEISATWDETHRGRAAPAGWELPGCGCDAFGCRSVRATWSPCGRVDERIGTSKQRTLMMNAKEL